MPTPLFKGLVTSKSWHRRLAGAREYTLFTTQARRLCHQEFRQFLCHQEFLHRCHLIEVLQLFTSSKPLVERIQMAVVKIRELGGNTFDFPIELSWEVTLKQLEMLPE